MRYYQLPRCSAMKSVEPAGRVRISVGVSFGRLWLLTALPAIVQAHPHLKIEIDLDNRPVDLIAEGYDIGIRGGAPAHASLVARRLCSLPVALIASSDYLLREGVPTLPHDLAHHRCIQQRFPDGSVRGWSFNASSSAQRHEIEPATSLVVNESEAVVDLVLAGAGIAQAGLYGILPWLRSGQLKLVLSDVHDPGAREFHLHYPDRRFMAPRVRVVVDALLTFFQSTPDLHLRRDDLPPSFKASTP